MAKIKDKKSLLRKQKQCRFCKKEKDFLMTDGNYFVCRECNTKRCRRYRRTKRGAENVRRAVARSIKKYPWKQRSRVYLNYMVKVGRVIRPKRCSVCRKIKPIEGHHSDYSKPLDVVWVCRQCHSVLELK